MEPEVQDVARVGLRALEKSARLLVSVPLRPLQGERFQPTGFPDLGAGLYSAPDGTEMLVVESPQSMANRLEAVCWDSAKDDLVEDLRGLPYVRVELGDEGAVTASVLEAHRLNSPYILGEGGDEKFRLALLRGMGLPGRRRGTDGGGDEGGYGIINLRAVAATVFRVDPGSLLHGVFLEKLEGRLRIARALSAFIEARDVRPAATGGVKFDRYAPSGDTKKGFGHVPFHRTEYTAREITLAASLDLAQIRGYGLAEQAQRLLIALAVWKLRRFLEEGLRLRTACDFDVAGEIRVDRPGGFELPELETLTAEVKQGIAQCAAAGLFAEPPVTVLKFGGFPKGQAKAAAAAGSDVS